MSDLTDKQIKFCNLYIELGSGADAYRQAYNVKATTKNETCANNAYKLLQDNDIITTVEELRVKTSKQHGIDRAFIIKGLLEIISDADYTFNLGKDNKLTKEDGKAFYRIMQQTKNTDKLRALEQLAKMLGLNEPDKSEVKQTIEIVEKKRE
jgi:hypothetical protein